MKVTMATLALLGLSQARVAKRKENVIGGVCFDMGDCLITGYGLVSCDHSGANGMLMGILGSCVDGKTVKASTSSSSGGLMSMLGLGKRHGPDDDDDALVVVVAANATAAAAPKPMAAMAGMAGMSMHKRHGPDDDEAPAANSTAMAGMVMKKRHGPDDDDDVVKVNATAAASTSMAGMVMKN